MTSENHLQVKLWTREFFSYHGVLVSQVVTQVPVTDLPPVVVVVCMWSVGQNLIFTLWFVQIEPNSISVKHI